MKMPITFAAFAALGFLAGCATTEESPGPRGQPAAQQQPADEGLIGERRDPETRAKAHTDLAAAYFGLGNLGVALEEVRLALAADPNYAAAHNVQGLVYMDLKDNAAAERSFARAMQLAPGDPDILHNYGWFLCQTGREDQSVQYFLNAIKAPLYRSPAKSYAAAGQCLMRKGRDAEAAGYFDRALRLDPNNLQALIPYAELQYRRGAYDDARKLIARYNKLVEPSAESLWLGLRIDRRLGERAGEQGYANQLRRRYPQSPEYQKYMRGEFD